MCPFCFATVAMVTAGVASAGALGAVLVRTGLARGGKTKADMDGTGAESSEYNERRRGDDECN